MIEIARERNISAPAARVWEVVAEAERLPEWYARAASAEVLEGAGLGRRQRLRSQWRGQDSEVDQLITAFEPEHLLEWRHEAERLGGQPAPRFALETVVRIKLEAQGPDATRVASGPCASSLILTTVSSANRGAGCPPRRSAS